MLAARLAVSVGQFPFENPYLSMTSREYDLSAQIGLHHAFGPLVGLAWLGIGGTLVTQNGFAGTSPSQATASSRPGPGPALRL